MYISISNSSDIPIYEQIKSQIKNQILNGTLSENEMLPSIRSLAADIRISIMTIKKAYDELEEEGFIITRHGKGSFVSSKNTEWIKEERLKDIEMHLEGAIQIAKESLITRKEVEEIFEYLYGDDENETSN